MATPQKTNRRKNHKKRFYQRKRVWLSLFLFMVLVAAIGLLGVNQYTKEYRERAETYDLTRINDLEIPSVIVDRGGTEIGRIFVQNRSLVGFDRIPKVFIDALLAGEDKRFYDHDGVDYRGIARAVYLNWKAGETTQGASTITQQLARNAFPLEDERKKYNESGIQRKMVEAFLARRIEKTYSKSQILEFYLNRIYLGSGFYGIRSASLGYFGKEPEDLTVLECAAIVGCIKNPSNNSPLNSLSRNQKARNMVLERMKQMGNLKRKDYKRLVTEKLKLNPKPLQRGTSHLYERVANELGRLLGEDALAAGGFTVHTTILSRAQEAAERALEESLSRAEAQAGFSGQKHADYSKQSGERPEYLQGAVLMVDHLTGDVLAHVGGRDYAQAPYDFIELGKRPLGTAFFPYIYAAALENGMTPATQVEDEPMDNRSVMVGGREGILGEWGMEVLNPEYENGPITLRKALEFSKVAATVRVADRVGLKKVVDMAVKFGMPLEDVELLPRLAVGFEPVSLKQAMRAMSVYANRGRISQGGLVYIDRVVDRGGRVIYRRKRTPQNRTQIIDPATAWQVHSMMAGSMYRGSSKGALEGMLESPFPGAGKGGSTSDFGDCWFIGYNARVTCGVWTGFLSGGGEAIYPGAFSRDLALPVWKAAMNAAAPSFGGDKLTAPSNVLEVPICSVSGQRATEFCHEYSEDPGSGIVKTHSTAVNEFFREGTEKVPYCTKHSGALGAGSVTDMHMLDLPALSAVPIKPKDPVLIGNDPFHTRLPSFAATSESSGFVGGRTNVLDSLDLGDVEEAIKLRRPGRLEIYDE
ncbi:MAG: transglycosylase domain-containing protein [Verrucomicrobiales bacterium]